MSEDERAKYLQECKDRALAFLPNIQNALCSIMSDLGKHSEFAGIAEKMMPLALHYAIRGDQRDARNFIVGFR